MTHALPPLTKDLIDAFTASAVAWLMWLMGVVCRLGVFSTNRRLHRLVAYLERGVESIMFLKAVHRFGPTRRRTRRPGSAAPGFRRHMRMRRRLFYRNANVRARKADLGARLSALAAALANPAPHIAYFFKRILSGLRLVRLIPFAPLAHTLAADAPQHAAIADSS